LKTLVYLSLTIASALVFIAAIVFGLRDATTFVPPPEAVVESFVHELKTKRYIRAMSYLSPDCRMKVRPLTLKESTERLKLITGEISGLRGEKGWIHGDSAEASVKLKTELSGSPSLKFPLSRRNGIWSISDLRSLEIPGLKIN
jgi:hypothetical protein